MKLSGEIDTKKYEQDAGNIQKDNIMLKNPVFRMMSLLNVKDLGFARLVLSPF